MPQADLHTTWQEVRDELRRSASDLTFHLWLAPLELVGRDSDRLFVRAPAHIRTLVEERYALLVRDAAARALSAPVTVEIVDEHWGAESAAGEGRRSAAVAEPLNPSYTFQQFVIGDTNRMAHAASLVVAEQPGVAYNPLFLYGPPGLGKTHLLHAIGNYVRRFGAGLTVRYATAEEFTSAFVGALKRSDTACFKAAFRGVDLLLLDDVQFLGGRDRTREELFHTFNALHESGCQLVLSSDRAPEEMEAFERRLAERFASGLVAELGNPDVEVRIAILRKRAALGALPHLPEETLRETARRSAGSVRTLEGALVRLVAHASLTGEEPTPELARELLPGSDNSAPPTELTVDAIQKTTAREFGLSPAALAAHDRRPHVALARQVAMYLARELTSASLPAIGDAFGGRNHSTVLHAHRKITRTIGEDEETAARIAALSARLGAPLTDRAR